MEYWLEAKENNSGESQAKTMKCASAEFHFILLKFMSAQNPPSDPNGESRH